MSRHFACTLLPLTLWLATTALSAEPTELQGTWTEIIPDRPRNGKRAPREPLTLVVDGASLLEKTQNRIVRQSLFTIVPGKCSSIDFMTVVDGEFWLTRAIYKIEDDVLTVCEAGQNEKRPTLFQGWEALGDRLTSLRKFKRRTAE